MHFTIGFWNGHYLAFLQSPTCHQLGSGDKLSHLLAEEPLERPGNCTSLSLCHRYNMWNHIIAHMYRSMVRSDRVPAIVISQAEKSKICSTCPGTSLGIPQNSHKTWEIWSMFTPHKPSEVIIPPQDVIWWSQPPLMAFLRMDALV